MKQYYGSIPLGQQGSISFTQEDKWIYPTISLESGQGEYAYISLQHMSSEDIFKLSDNLKELAFKLKEAGL